jgi:cell division protein YceG involved in septum cleavage
MAKFKSFKFPLTSVILVILLFIGTTFVIQDRFGPPRKDASPVEFTIGKNFTDEAIVNDLQYFGFIKDRNAFKLALRLKGGTINREAKYTISQSMTAWQIADILLNHSDKSSCNHGCPDSNFNPELIPGGDLAPTVKEKYEWVKTYEDCVKAIGSDGGQLSSEQYAEKTGIRKCVSPDGREFTQGKDGWTTSVGG